MKAAQFQAQHKLGIISKDLRALREGEVLVKVEVCGICGTDLHIVEGTARSSPPVVLGHEYAGVVVDSSGVDEVRDGQRVAVDPNISCGICFYCRRGLVHLCENLRALGVDIDGGMAEFSIVPWKQVHALPDDLTFLKSTFIEPVSCAIHGIDLAGIRHGDTVVILGGGTIGLVMLQLAIHGGSARVIVVEPVAERRTLATGFGAHVVLDPQGTDIAGAIHDLTLVGADVVIECAGRSDTARLAISLARKGGRVELFGVCPIGQTISIEPNQIYFRELTIVGSYVNPHTFGRSIELLRSGVIDLDRVPVSLLPLAGLDEAFELQRNGKAFKCILQPQS